MKKIILKKEDIGKGYLILVNSNYKISNSDIVLAEFNDKYKEIKLEYIARNTLLYVLNKVLKINNEIIPISGYRTLEEQIKIYNDSLQNNGENYTKKYIAIPNASEHQTGLAIDLALNQKNIDFICPKFPYYGICQEFRNISQDYGFIERYKEDKINITQIAKEEWHFRYVGYPHSKIITENNFCLEEYIDYLRNFIYPTNPLYFEGYKIFYIPYKDEDINLSLNEEYTMSGNNVDGFILTLKTNKNK